LVYKLCPIIIIEVFELDDKKKGVLIGAIIVILFISLVGLGMAIAGSINGQDKGETFSGIHSCSDCKGFEDNNSDGVCDHKTDCPMHINKTGCPFEKSDGLMESGCHNKDNMFGGCQGSGGCRMQNSTEMYGGNTFHKEGF
jgi:hypothetical protein